MGNCILPLSKLFSEVKVCILLASPLVSAQLAQAGMGWIDTVMMGQLGRQALAAGGFGATLFITLLLIGTHILLSVSSLVAEAYVTGDIDRVRVVVAQGLWLSIAISIPSMVLLWSANSWLRAVGQPEELVPLTQAYLKALAWGVFPAFAFGILRSFATVVNHPQVVFVAAFTGLGCNVFANDVLMYGKFGLPALGLTGIGWASTLASWLMFLGLAIYIFTQRQLRKYKIFDWVWHLEFQTLWQLIYLGGAFALFSVAEDGLFTVMTILMGQFGTMALAAHQIVLQTIAMTVMVPLGISHVMTVRIGQLKGVAAFRQMQLTGSVGLGLGASFMAGMTLLFWMNPKSIVSWYLDIHDPMNQEVVHYAVQLLQIAAVFQLFDGTQIIATGLLRGLQDAVIPMWIGIVAYWGFGLLSGYLMGVWLRWEGMGLWCGLAVGLAIAAGALVWRFFTQIQLMS